MNWQEFTAPLILGTATRFASEPNTTLSAWRFAIVPSLMRAYARVSNLSYVLTGLLSRDRLARALGSGRRLTPLNLALVLMLMLVVAAARMLFL